MLILEINNHTCQLAKKWPRPAAITLSLGSNNHPYKKNDEVQAAFCFVGESLSKRKYSKIQKRSDFRRFELPEVRKIRQICYISIFGISCIAKYVEGRLKVCISDLVGT